MYDESDIYNTTSYLETLLHLELGSIYVESVEVNSVQVSIFRRQDQILESWEVEYSIYTDYYTGSSLMVDLSDSDFVSDLAQELNAFFYIQSIETLSMIMSPPASPSPTLWPSVDPTPF